MQVDRPLLGILLMLGFCIVAPMGDAVAKLLGQTMPIGFLLLVRFAVQAVILSPMVMATRRPWRMTSRLFKFTLLRTALHIAGIAAMFTALQYLELADAIAIAFVMPFIMLLLGKFFLGELVGSRRIAACGVGFIGTLMVIQPSFAEVGWPALLPVVVAVVFSFFMLVTRHIAKETDPISLQAISGWIAIVALLPVLTFGHTIGLPALDFVSPNGTEIFLLAAIGILGTVAHLFMTWSLRFAPSATLAPMQYLEIPFGTFIGYLVFKDLPNGLAALGICVTIAAGIYVIARERSTARSAATEPMPPITN